MEHDRDLEKEYMLEDIICDGDDEDVTLLFLNLSHEGDEQSRSDGSGEGDEIEARDDSHNVGTSTKSGEVY
jgi:hypothetical protein